jgi:hypothetical protein
MLNKRGQLFLIAALVISGILISLAALYTTTQKPEEDKIVYDLSSELNYETAQVIDQAVFQGITQTDLDKYITNLTDYYVTQNPGNDIIIVYGNDTLITVREYVWRAGSVSLGNAGAPQTAYNITTRNITPIYQEGQQTGTVPIPLTNSITQTFRIVKGQNFISVIKKVLSNQTYVATGGNAVNEPVSTTAFYCTGTIPQNAVLCPDDALRLTANTEIKLVRECTNDRKCEYNCSAEYYYYHNTASDTSSGSCVYYHPNG